MKQKKVRSFTFDNDVLRRRHIVPSSLASAPQQPLVYGSRLAMGNAVHMLSCSSLAYYPSAPSCCMQQKQSVMSKLM